MAGLYEIYHGSAHHMPQIADRSVHAVICSPPYMGLRAYAGDQDVEWPAVAYAPMPGMPALRIPGCDPSCAHEWVEGPVITRSPLRDHDGKDFGKTRGQEPHRAGAMPTSVQQGCYCRQCGGWKGGLGAELSIEMYIGHLVLCLREWWRVLRDDGTLWLNISDSYANDTKWGGRTGGKHVKGLHGDSGIGRGRTETGLRAKNLMMIPERLALAAQADGWIVRSKIVWTKAAPMPESVRDRPARAHEYIFLLAKSERYFFDHIAIQEPAKDSSVRRIQQPTLVGAPKFGGNSWEPDEATPLMVNRRDVWPLSPSPFAGGHFATFPLELPELCMRAGTSARGVCAACGAPWRRVTTAEFVPQADVKDPDRLAKAGNKGLDESNGWGDAPRGTTQAVTTGWEPTCRCEAGEPVPATVLDPFVGSGTTLRAAVELSRRGVGVDISQVYLETLVPKRMAGVQIGLGI